MATDIGQASSPWMYRRALRLALNYLIAIAIGIIMIFPLLWDVLGRPQDKGVAARRDRHQSDSTSPLAVCTTSSMPGLPWPSPGSS